MDYRNLLFEMIHVDMEQISKEIYIQTETMTPEVFSPGLSAAAESV